MALTYVCEYAHTFVDGYFLHAVNSSILLWGPRLHQNGKTVAWGSDVARAHLVRETSPRTRLTGPQMPLLRHVWR